MTTATLSHAPSDQFLAAIRQRFATWFSARQPAAARPLTRYEEAEQLRAMANDLLSSDPAFAQDLYAAADRHEVA
ncbi:MAG: hypothetical protein KA254_01730 [Rhodoferax sp.]|nr:hypothetical protein [Rhodoferax sp.]